MPRHYSIDERMRQLHLRPCSLEGCHSPAWRLSPLCRKHRRRQENTGDPEGDTVRAKELEAYRSIATAYLTDHADHPTIMLGRQLMAGFLYWGAAHAPGRVDRRTSPNARAKGWIAAIKRQGVDPLDALAELMAVHILHLEQPDRFRSAGHYAHQVALRFCRLAKPPFANLADPLVTSRNSHLTAGTAKSLFRFIRRNVGSFVSQAAEAAIRYHQHIQEKGKMHD